MIEIDLDYDLFHTWIYWMTSEYLDCTAWVIWTIVMVLLLCVERLKGVFLQQELNECRLTKLQSEVVTGFNLTYGQKIIIFSYVLQALLK